MPKSRKPQLTTYEKALLARQKLRKNLEKYGRKNRKKISFMFIPHDEKHIYKIELSFFMLYFLGFLVLLLSAISIYSFSDSWFSPRNPEIYSKNRRNTAVFLLYDLYNQELKQTYKKLSSQTRDLNYLVWGVNSSENLITRDFYSGVSAREFSEETPAGNNIFQNIVMDASVISGKLEYLLPFFQNASGYLHSRETIFSSLPRGKPLKPGVGFVTSTFGYRIDPFGLTVGDEFHSGVDFASGEGTPIYATGPGVIGRLFNSAGGLGKAVQINHINGIYSLYGHCSKVLVTEGQYVKKGQKIALVGSTGKATGAHIHYEVRIGLDTPSDPVEFINLE